MDGKVDSDVKLYIREMFDELKGEVRNGHPTTRVGKAIQNNASVIFSVAAMIFSATWWVSTKVSGLDIAVTTTLPNKIDTGQEKLSSDLKHELQSREQASRSNDEKRAYLLADLQETDKLLTGKVDRIIQVCCPKGIPIGEGRPGESPTYVVNVEN